MKKWILFMGIALPALLFAQRQTTGNLTVFSEDGDKFYLVLNGEKQNDKPQANIRVEELPQPYYSSKIIFVDSTLATISKNIQIADADNKMMDVTYRIRKDKTNKPKMTAFSSIEVKPDFVAPAGMYVHHYGGSTGGGSITQTTTTKTSSNTVDANVSVPGISMNVTINEPNEQVLTSTTTTTTTTHSSTTINDDEPAPTGSGNNCRGWAMKTADFNAAKNTISETSFEETKLSTAKSITASNCLSADQVSAICNLFSFEASKLEFAKYAYKYTIDPKNYFKVNNVFSFDASKDELSKFISGE